MSRRKKQHIAGLDKLLGIVASTKLLDLHRYSPYHFRITDGGYTTLDIWTTGRYYVLTTDYQQFIGEGHVERGGEKGQLTLESTEEFIDKLFFPEGKDE